MRCAVRSTPSPDTSQPLRDSGMSPPVLRPAVPDTAARPSSDPPPATPRPALCIFSALRTVPSRYRGPAFRRRLSHTFSRASRNTVPPLLPACRLFSGMPRGPGHRGPCPSRHAISRLRPLFFPPRPASSPPLRRACSSPPPCSLFPALRTPPRQKQAKFRQ